MTDEDYDRIRPVIDLAARLHARLNDKLIERGVEPIDAALASIESVSNLAARLHGGDAHTGIEWMRTALDTFERQLLAGARAAH